MRLFTPAQVEEILTLQGLLTQQEIANRFGVDRRRIGEIFNGDRHYHAMTKRLTRAPQEVAPQAAKVKMTFWSNS